MKNENQLKLIHRTGTFEISSKLCCCCWIARLKSAFLFAIVLKSALLKIFEKLKQLETKFFCLF